MKIVLKLTPTPTVFLLIQRATGAVCAVSHKSPFEGTFRQKKNEKLDSYCTNK